MNKEQLKYYQEKAQSKGKKLLIEECNSIITIQDVEFLKEGKLIESEGKQFEALAVVKNCPVSKYTKNKNNRTYSKDLWEYVKKNGIYEGTYSLADHPVEEGSVKDAWGIWHGLNLTEEGAFSDLYLIEEKPVRILKAGGSLGTSSVGYGEFLEDGETVDPASYELERLGDIVLNPSQGTFATLENVITEQKTLKNDISFLKEDTNKNNKNDIILENKQNTNNVEDLNKMTKAEFMNAKNHIKIALKEARSSKAYKESISNLEELYVDTPDEMVEQKTEIKSTISEIQLKMEEEIKNTSKSLADKENEFNELKTKYDTANNALTELKERYEKAEAIINKSGLQNENSVVYTKEDAEILESNLKAMKEDITNMEEDRVAMEEDMEIMEEDMENMLDDIKKFKEERTSLRKQIKINDRKLKKAENHIEKLEKILEDEFDFEFEQDDVIPTNDVFGGDEIIVDGEVYTEEEVGQDITGGTVAQSSFGNDTVNVEDNSNSLGNAGDNAKTRVDEPGEPDYDEDKAAEGGVETPSETQAASTYVESEDEDEDDKDEVKEEEGDDEKKDDDEDKEEVKEEEDDKKDDDEKDDEKDGDDKKEEAYVFKPKSGTGKIVETSKAKSTSAAQRKPAKIQSTREVVDFYVKAAKEKPFLKDFRQEILSSKSLMEAVDKVSAIKNKSNDMIKVKTNLKEKTDDEIVNYEFKSKW